MKVSSGTAEDTERARVQSRDVAQKVTSLAQLSDIPILHTAFRGAFPKTLRVKFPYADEIFLTPGLSGAYHLFRANDLYDPDYTATGHQPLGFDQYMLFYQHFVIVSSKIVVQMIGSNTEPLAGAYVFAIRLGATTTTHTTYSAFAEDPWSRWTLCAAAPYGHARLELQYHAADFYGEDFDTILSNPSFWGTTAASPTEDTYFQIALLSVAPGVVTAVEAPIYVHIEYEAELFEPKLLAQS